MYTTHISKQGDYEMPGDLFERTETDSKYTELNTRYNNLYRFVMQYDDYIYSSRTYGGDEPLTMIDAHTLSYIDDNPGVTPSELIKFWDKTKGAISQILSRLELMGLIEKKKEDGNQKTIHLYVTETGRKMSLAHKEYDIQDIAKTLSQLTQKCSMEEISTFYKVICAYNEVIKNDFELNAERREK